MTVLGARDTKIHDFDIAIGCTIIFCGLISRWMMSCFELPRVPGQSGSPIEATLRESSARVCGCRFEVSSPEVLHDDVV